jgi:hypothetical protein
MNHHTQLRSCDDLDSVTFLCFLLVTLLLKMFPQPRAEVAFSTKNKSAVVCLTEKILGVQSMPAHQPYTLNQVSLDRKHR